MAIFAIYNLFLLLNESTPEHKNYLDLTHPEPSLRIKYIIPFFMNCMSSYYTDWTIDEIKLASKNIYQACLNFDISLNSNQIFINEIKNANTKNGDNHCLKLLNSIPNTQFLYGKKAIIQLKTMKKVTEDFLNIFKELQI